MPFGITCATSSFQREIDKMLKGMDFVVAFVDDLVVTGRTDQEHLENLRIVLEKLKQTGLTVRRKNVFFQDEYFEHVITKDGQKIRSKNKSYCRGS